MNNKMAGQQDYWATLQKKYEDKNKTLQQRQLELRCKLEAMDAIIGDGQSKKPQLPLPPTSPPTLPPTSPTYNPPPPLAPNTFSPPSQIQQYSPPQSVLPPGYTSCICPPPQEKTGFLKGIFSIIPSFKSKGPAPSPQNVPPQKLEEQVSKLTPKGDGTTMLESSPKKNLNCLCNLFKKNSDSTCNCSVCNSCTLDNDPILTSPQNIPSKEQKQEVQKNKGCLCNSYVPEKVENPVPKKNLNCICNTCPILENTQSSQKKESSSICNCSICSKISNLSKIDLLNVGKPPDNKAITTIKPDDDLCICSICSKTGGDLLTELEQKGINIDASSKMSLKSMDLYYMKNVHDLATQQKTLLNNVNELERKAKIYEEVFKEYKDTNFNLQTTQKCEEITDPEQKSNAELKLENFLLKNELKDMRLEVRQYIERMEGPMQYKIESEKYKCFQLEQKLEQAAKDMAQTLELYEKELNTLKMQLCTANNDVYNLTALNENLMSEMQECKAKCTQLAEDLIRQKISEAESLKAMQAALNAQMNADVVKEECNLHQIARELSTILKECEPCGECITLPEDLTTTAKMLKNLTDIIDQKIPVEATSSVSSVAEKIPDTVVPVQESHTSVVISETCQCVSCPGLNGKDTTLHEQIPADVKPSEKEEQSQKETTDEIKVSEDAKTTEEIKGSEKEKSEKGSVKRQKEEVKTSIKEQPEKGSIKSQLESVKSKTEEVKTSIKEQSEKASLKSEPKITEAKPDKIEKTTTGASIKSHQSGSIKSGSKIPPNCICAQCKKYPKAEPKPIEEISPKESFKPSQKEYAVTPSNCQCAVCEEMLARDYSRLPRKSCQCATKAPVQKAPAKYISKNAREPCDCSKKTELSKPPAPATPIALAEPRKTIDDGVDQLWPKKDDQKITKALPDSDKTQFKHLTVNDNFPFEVDTHVDVLDKRPDGVHVTTTITDSGVLEVVTEGPDGYIETTLIYTDSGNVEVVTEVLDYHAQGKMCNRGIIKALPPSGGEPQMMPSIKTKGCAPLPLGADISPNCQCKPCLDFVTNAGLNNATPLDVKADVTPNINPNCQCKTCPALETEKVLVVDELQQETTPEKAVEAHSKESLPEECQCVSCPRDELEIKETTSEVKESVPNMELPEECQCISCPQTELKASNLTTRSSQLSGHVGDSPSSTERPEGCQCYHCPADND